MQGQAWLEVKQGVVHVLGKMLDMKDGRHRIVSPPSSSMLFIENPSSLDSAELDLTSIRDGLENMRMSNGESILGLPQGHLETFLLNPQGEYRFLDIPNDWMEVASAISADKCSPPIILVCGPRKIGKSTFCRFLLNKLLNVHDEIAHIDLDPGQTEFMPPGFVSLNLLSSPLLGNFIRILENSYLFFRSADRAPGECYPQSLRRLYKC